VTSVKADICIIGGGPAGLTLALALLRSGASVAVAERASSLDRPYRGEILQPGGAEVLEGVGVLAGATARGCFRIPRFQLVAAGRRLLDIDYGILPGPHAHLISIPQRHLLEELLDRCQEWPGFTYLPGARITDLLRYGPDRRISGAFCATADGPIRIAARCVVGADGRYSKTRRLADIDGGRLDVFDQDVMWARLRAAGRPLGAVQVRQASGRPMIAYDSWPDQVQLGWLLPHGGYQQAVAGGIEQIVADMAAALPEYADLIHEQIQSLRDLTLLDVFGGCAERWTEPGLALIGDAAHTHSPLGAQGVNLALQDAAVLHPILLRALADGAPADALAEFERVRRPDIEAVLRFQVRQSKGMLPSGPVAAALRPRIAGVIARTPLAAKITKRIAYGRSVVRVDTSRFTHAEKVGTAA
jgi:6-methylpretetramide 4-monooxygenase